MTIETHTIMTDEDIAAAGIQKELSEIELPQLTTERERELVMKVQQHYIRKVTWFREDYAKLAAEHEDEKRRKTEWWERYEAAVSRGNLWRNATFGSWIAGAVIIWFLM